MVALCIWCLRRRGLLRRLLQLPSQHSPVEHVCYQVKAIANTRSVRMPPPRRAATWPKFTPRAGWVWGRHAGRHPSFGAVPPCCAGCPSRFGTDQRPRRMGEHHSARVCAPGRDHVSPGNLAALRPLPQPLQQVQLTPCSYTQQRLAILFCLGHAGHRTQDRGLGLFSTP